ncbi:lipopolysaccharide biosynthesis protein [Occallatibacter savannae]|uniref:lipopolysaccharide biosynthesis protein n=1 Tax=Occallatibacter savannae TaxID=1002691 RepID=UPI0019529BC5|nr:polysaccharide biosynthesis C-terminal domain-containing protein [Occallatibacter savannae]
MQWSERVRLFRDSTWNIASLAVSGLVGLVLVPIMFRGLGTERYGLWLAASSMVDIAGGLGFGLGLLIVREVASSAGGSEANGCERLVSTSRLLYAALGLVVLIAISAIAKPASHRLHLSHETQVLVGPIFILVGIAFAGEQISAVGLAVLAGLRRFDLIGSAAIALTIANGLLTYELLRTGHSILSIACLRVGLSVTGAIATSVMVYVIQPSLGKWDTKFELRTLRNHAAFIFASQANTVISKAIFDGVTPMIGFVLGAAAIVPYRVGLKFPQFLAGVSGRIAEVLYPASSEYHVSDSLHRLRDVLQWSTRALTLVNAPVLAVLFVLGPTLLHVWIPAAPPESVQVLRIYVFAAFFDALGYAADSMLWGAGEAKALLMILLSSGTVTLVVGFACMLHFGVAGMAIGVSAGFAVGTAQLIAFSCKKFEIPLKALLRFIFRGLALPTAVCILSVWAICRATHPTHVYVLGLIGAAGMMLFMGCHLSLRSSWEEREILLRLFRRRLAHDGGES